jgi:hypothetical protein
VVEIKGPLHASAGERTRFELRASDDGRVDHAVVWANGRKLRYLPGGERKVEGSFELLPEAGSNSIVVIAEDDQGLRTRSAAWLLAELPDAGPVVAEDGEGEEPALRP